MGQMMHRDHGGRIAIPFVPLPMACFGAMMAFMLGMMIGMRKAGGMHAMRHGHWDGHGYGYGHGYGKKMGMQHQHHHHHHGFGASECECGEGGGPEREERPEGV